MAGRWASTTLCSVESGRGALGEGRGSLRTEPQILSNWGSSILSVSYPMMHPLEDWAETKVLLLKRKKGVQSHRSRSGPHCADEEGEPQERTGLPQATVLVPEKNRECSHLVFFGDNMRSLMAQRTPEAG